jgi:hypothetical protein
VGRHGRKRTGRLEEHNDIVVVTVACNSCTTQAFLPRSCGTNLHTSTQPCRYLRSNTMYQKERFGGIWTRTNFRNNNQNHAPWLQSWTQPALVTCGSLPYATLHKVRQSTRTNSLQIHQRVSDGAYASHTTRLRLLGHRE